LTTPKFVRTSIVLTLLLATPGVTTIMPRQAWAQGEKSPKADKADKADKAEGDKPEKAEKSGAATLAQAADKWEQAMLTEALPLYEQALKEGGLYPADVVVAYARIGTVQALKKNKEAALSSFRVAAVIDPQFQLPSESGKEARKLYEDARKAAAKQGGKLEIAGEAPERVDASKSFTVVAKVPEAFAPVVEKVGIEVRDSLGKGISWKSDQPSTTSVTFEVPGKFVPGATTLLVRVSALDQFGNRWATQELKVKVREGQVEAPPVAPVEEKKESGGFFSGPWPYVIGGAVLLVGVGAFLITRPANEVKVGAPTWR
jgi:hypothetical protein